MFGFKEFRWLYAVRRDGLLVAIGEIQLIFGFRHDATCEVERFYAQRNPGGVTDGHKIVMLERHSLPSGKEDTPSPARGYPPPGAA